MAALRQKFGGIAVIFALLLLLAGCGGGGDGEDMAANRPPVADAGVDQMVVSGDSVTLDGSGSSDPDGTVVGYLWAQTTGPMVSLSADDQVSTSFVAPNVNMPTTLVFRLTVTDDDGATASHDVTVTVNAANRPPVADAGVNQTVDAGDSVTLDGSGSSDPDGTIAVYLWAQTTGPTVSLSTDDQVSTSFVAPNVNMPTTLVFRLTVTDDDGATASHDVTVTVNAANRPPVADAGVNQTVDAGDSVTLDGSGSSDPDGTIAVYLWAQTTGPTVSLSTDDQVSTSFVAPNVNMPTTLVFRLTVADDDGATASHDVTVTVTGPPPIDVDKYLTGPVAQGKSPALFAAVIDEQGIRAVGAAGVRRRGLPHEVTVDDLIHIASNGKAMTTTMLAVLVEDGVFPDGWATTIADVFPELVGHIHPDYEDVELFELVRMTGGLPNPILSAHLDVADIIERRYAILRDELMEPPVGPVGEFSYSNLGYVAAGAMAEELTGQSWETLMEDHLFAPLGITSVGFGPPGTIGAVDQPWGHERDSAGQWTPVQRDNPEAGGPAGTMHISIEDWAKFIALWFSSQTPAILDRAAFDELLVTDSEEYAAGWVVVPRDWAEGMALTHQGTNLTWSTWLWVAPDRGIAYLAAANAWDPDTFGVLDTVIAGLITDTLPSGQ